MRKLLSIVSIVFIIFIIGCASSIGNQYVDLSKITSREQAYALYNEGKLEKVYLFPLELGGVDAEINVIYLPHKVAESKVRIEWRLIKPNAPAGCIARH